MTTPEFIRDSAEVPFWEVPKILVYPNPRLRQRSEDIAEAAFDTRTHSLLRMQIRSLAAAIRTHDGVAIAAPQIGWAARVVVLGAGLFADGPPIACINPSIIESSNMLESGTEGCLSFPGVFVDIPRPVAVKVRAQTPAGEWFELDATGFSSRAICHELEHLDGKLLIDHVGPVRARLIKARMEKLARRAKQKQKRRR